MKIAIVGSSGFIGAYLSKTLISKGHSVVGIDINEPGENLPGFTFIKSDNENTIQNSMCDLDGVVILAGKRYTLNFGIEDYLYNINITSRWISLCRKNGIKNIVLASSISVYSDFDSIPWKEESNNLPLNLYGVSKKTSDNLALYYNYYHDMCIKSLRFAQVIGMGERKGYLLNTLIDNAINKETMNIFGSGKGKRQYIYIKDICSSVIAALTQYDVGGIFNIGMPDNISIKDLALCINDEFENTGNITFLKDKPEDLKEYLMDITKAKTQLNWVCEYDTVKAVFKDLHSTL